MKLSEWLEGCDVVIIDVINTRPHCSDKASARESFRFVSGTPKGNEVIKTLKELNL